MDLSYLENVLRKTEFFDNGEIETLFYELIIFLEKQEKRIRHLEENLLIKQYD